MWSPSFEPETYCQSASILSGSGEQGPSSSPVEPMLRFQQDLANVVQNVCGKEAVCHRDQRPQSQVLRQEHGEH